MNIQVLIDSIVRQTTILIAQLATSAGVRAPLAHVANQVFLELVTELKAQGLGNKVIADMFGLALRTYHARLRRLSESKTYQGKSLWEAVLEHVQGKGTVLRADVLRRFANDEEASVKGVLKDLVDSGMLFRSGREQATTYRAASPEDVAQSASSNGVESLANLVWVAVHRQGPVSRGDLGRTLSASDDELEAALDWLLAEGRIEALDREGEQRFRSQSCVIPVGAAASRSPSSPTAFPPSPTSLAPRGSMAQSPSCASTCASSAGITNSPSTMSN
ncbi:MAG TPA: crosslink repair DNA glycosylase YcaQ family protein, partial [Polyangiaceae bacterium]|nr:crosslink repair DNA glycosylase YcaQ family protein [Polyangiaceae bacterium]